VAAQAENEAAWRQLLVQSVLAVLLPTEELENACLRALVTDIFSEIILKNIVMEMVCQNWILWKWIAQGAEAARAQTGMDGDSVVQPTRRRQLSLTSRKLERFGLLGSPDTDVSPGTSPRQSAQMSSSLSATLWSYVAYIFMAFGLVRNLVAAFVAANRGDESGQPNPASPSASSATPLSAVPPFSRVQKKAILDLRAWTSASQVLRLPERMPWLTGCCALAHHYLMNGPGKMGQTGGVLDR
jgi:hypothetical protein